MPVWFEATHTTWFSRARAASKMLNRWVHRSSATSAAPAVREAGQAEMQAIVSAPSRASARAASGKALS